MHWSTTHFNDSGKSWPFKRSGNLNELKTMGKKKKSESNNFFPWWTQFEGKTKQTVWNGPSVMLRQAAGQQRQEDKFSVLVVEQHGRLSGRVPTLDERTRRHLAVSYQARHNYNTLHWAPGWGGINIPLFKSPKIKTPTDNILTQRVVMDGYKYIWQNKRPITD